MSEDYIFNKNQKKEEERKLVPDIFGSLGKGMLAKEDIEILRKSSGLTPLGFGVDVRDRVLNRCSMGEGFSTTEVTENTEILKNSSGLSPLRPFGEIHNTNFKSSSLDEVFPATEDAKTVRNSSGLTTLCPGSEIYKRRVIK